MHQDNTTDIYIRDFNVSTVFVQVKSIRLLLYVARLKGPKVDFREFCAEIKLENIDISLMPKIYNYYPVNC